MKIYISMHTETLTTTLPSVERTSQETETTSDNTVHHTYEVIDGPQQSKTDRKPLHDESDVSVHAFNSLQNNTCTQVHPNATSTGSAPSYENNTPFHHGYEVVHYHESGDINATALLVNNESKIPSHEKNKTVFENKNDTRAQDYEVIDGYEQAHTYERVQHDKFTDFLLDQYYKS